jgi:hypothetical protein
MDTTNYPNSCFYCKSKWNCDNCLLPFVLTTHFTQSGDSTIDTINLIELHTLYGIPNLMNNSEFTIWNHSRVSTPISTRQETEMSQQSIESLISQANEEANKFILTENERFELEREEVQHLSQEEKTTTQDQKDQQEKELKEEKESEEEEIEIITEKKTEPITREEYSKGKGKRIARIDDTPEPQLTLELEEDELAQRKLDRRDKIQHTANDIAKAIQFSYNSYKMKKTGMHTYDLVKSLYHEVENYFYHGEDYNYHFETKLDHPIGLSRELVASHHSDQLQDWQHEVKIRQTYGCILGFEPFTHEDRTQNEKLDQALLRYSNETLNSITNNEERDFVLSIIKDELIIRNALDVWNWFMKSQTLKIDTKKRNISALVNRPGFSMAGPSKSNITKPNLSEELKGLLNEHLKDATERTIMSRKSHIPRSLTKQYVGDTLNQLTTEFVQRTPQWLSPMTDVKMERFNRLKLQITNVITEHNSTLFLMLLKENITTLRHRIMSTGRPTRPTM